ncbi:pseudouridine synthase [Sanyastnella coralliicola]|uniref:pseudouridine synthase n=1 Tax=Sanyastnella coralliicola TaxID=3069118 RepID=UPI0027BB0C0D|nr:pseudouridine synthase [Longitalea sp. SCSIO 12813]
MREFKAAEDATLLDLIIEEFGYASKNKGRKLIKAKQVMVNGNIDNYPSRMVEKGAHIKVLDEPKVEREAKPTKNLPFVILHEDESVLAFEKPAGWITASPDRKKRTAFSVVKKWLLDKDPELDEVFFVNKLPKDASGIVVVAKDAVTRVRLQGEWNRLNKRFYVLARGGFEEDGEIGYRSNYKKEEETFVFPFRTMMQGDRYAILRVEMKKESFSELFSMLDSGGTPVPGYARRGKADNPLGRLGLHFFSIEIPTAKGDEMIRTKMPKEFLNLVKFNHA